MFKVICLVGLVLVCGISHAQDGCSNGNTICLGCNQPDDCYLCHSTISKGDFYMTLIGDRWFCFCSCFGGTPYVKNNTMSTSLIKSEMPPINWSSTNLTNFGEAYKKLMSLYNVKQQQTQFASVHNVSKLNATTECGKNTINQILSSKYLK